MNAALDTKVKMFQTTDSTCIENKARLDIIPAYKLVYEQFKTRLTDIETLMKEALKSPKTTTKEKKAAKQNLVQTAVSVARTLSAWGASTGNEQVKSDMNIPASALGRTKDELLEAKCSTVWDTGTENLAAAEPFNLTRAMLDDLDLKIKDFAAKLSSPRTVQAKINSSKDLIATAAADIDKILGEQLDKIVHTLESADPDLVFRYDTARKLVSSPSTATQLKVFVTDNDTGMPVAKISTLLANGKDFPGETNDLGVALYKPIPYGVFSLKVEAPGYVPFLMPKLKVVRGRINKVKVVLKVDKSMAG